MGGGVPLKVAKLAGDPVLRAVVEEKLGSAMVSAADLGLAAGGVRGPGRRCR